MSVATPERRPEAIRIKAKGLLERRGSSTSLTIELAQAPESPPHMVTPTRECTAEEFLLSAGNVLSRAQLKRAVNDPATLYKEFWEVPLNLPEKVDVCGSGVKNRYCSVLPNPQSRVILPGFSDDPLAGYINANYIRVCKIIYSQYMFKKMANIRAKMRIKEFLNNFKHCLLL